MQVKKIMIERVISALDCCPPLQNITFRSGLRALFTNSSSFDRWRYSVGLVVPNGAVKGAATST